MQDLIPLYADNLVSEKTREIIDEHVARCPSCAKAVNEAKDSLKENFDCESVNYEGKDVDYLRKVRSSSRKKIIAGVCITLCLALIFAGIKLFVYGSPDYGYTVSIVSDSAGKYKVTSADASKLLGADVKSYAESPERVMKLLYELGL